MNWQHQTLESERDGNEAIEFERLTTTYADLDVMALPDGKFYVEAVHNCDGETFIGHADSLEEGQQMAERWLLEQVAEMLRAVGAEEIWMVRGAKSASLKYFRPEPDAEFDTFWINPESPMERLILIRFPAGDGGGPGIEYF